MMQGVPVMATDLPGVRVPVRTTGFGRIVPPRDPDAITRALIQISESNLDPRAGASAARELYLASSVVDRYAELLGEVLANGSEHGSKKSHGQATRRP